MIFELGTASMSKLVGVHTKLQAVIKLAITLTPIDFCVTEGLRTYKRQKMLFAAGASKTMNSRHLTGHAVDLAALLDGEIHWDWPLYYKLADAVKAAATSLKTPIEWGGDWETFKDGPHFQLPWSLDS